MEEWCRITQSVMQTILKRTPVCPGELNFTRCDSGAHLLIGFRQSLQQSNPLFEGVDRNVYVLFFYFSSCSSSIGIDVEVIELKN